MLLLRYAIWKVTPVFTTSVKHQRSYIRNQPDKFIIHHYHDLHSIKSGLNQYPIQCFNYGLWVSVRGPAKGFLLSALRLWVSGCRDKHRALFPSPVSTADQHWAGCVSRMLSYSDRLCLLSGTCTWNQDLT